MKQAFAWLLAIAGFVAAVVAFFIDAERPATTHLPGRPPSEEVRRE